MSTWTSRLLVEAIGESEQNGKAIDQRTVQLWLQDNGRGVSLANLRRLAIVFGCDDADSFRLWYDALAAAQKSSRTPSMKVRQPTASTAYSSELLDNRFPRSWLVRCSEALFADYSPVNLSIFVFCGSVCLGLISVVIGNHSITYRLGDGVDKQVGFLWAPNWTIVFLVLLPIYLAVIATLLQYWKVQGRRQLFPRIRTDELQLLWSKRNDAAALSYWAILFVCVPITSAFNWFGTHLAPVVAGDLQGLSVDWGRVAILRPDVVTSTESIFFSALVFLYMSVCSYLFFVGLLICILIVTDLYDLSKRESSFSISSEVNVPAMVVGHLYANICKSVVLGLLITILIKAQSVYLLSPDPNILIWLYRDALSSYCQIWCLGDPHAAA